jgi:SAM-dependent methyltransferase
VDHGARLVVAVDVAADALNLARQYFSRDQIIWLQDDCHVLKSVIPYAPFDVICSLENIEHLKEPEHFLRRVTELISPEGVLITSSPNRFLLNKLRGAEPNAPPRNPYHCREYTADEFKALLQGFFSDVTLWYQCHSLATRLRASLESALSVIWSNPAMRFGRWVQRVIRKRNIPRNLKELLPPERIEWEILQDDPGANVTWSFLAVCHQPKAH